MFRKAKNRFIEWSKDNKALLVTGARQVGKTYLIREFAKEQFGEENFVELNFIDNGNAKDIFDNATNCQDLLFRLSAVINKPLIKGKTVIFLDEVQVCSNIITAIKFLVDEGSYRYILSGSLLGTEMKDIRSVPVGYLDVIDMFPMDFEEFAIANGVSQDVISRLKDNFKSLIPVDDVVHNSMIKLFHMYLIIGGMPAVVKTYLETNNLKDVIHEQETINRLYKWDIAQYDKENKLYIDEIYNLIPSELNNQNKRFVLKNLNENIKFSHYENSFLWLKNAGVALPTYCADEPKVPLILSKSRNLFKLFSGDVGLLSAMYADSDLQLKLLNYEKDINYGAIYENAVAEELTSKGFDLYYYKNNKLGELDFLIEQNGKVVPIEVKSGKDYKKHNALTNVLSMDYDIDKAYIFSNANLSRDDKKIYLPIYMLMFIEKTKPLSTIFTPDLSALKS
jgi:hypothetical protein